MPQPSPSRLRVPAATFIDMSSAIQRRAVALMAVLLLAFGFVPAALAQDELTCPEFDGYTCDEWVTDLTGVVGDDTRLESTVSRIVERFGHQIAVVVIDSTNGRDHSEYAADLGNTWGVGDPNADDGIVILVAVEDRWTQIETGPGAPLSDAALDSIRNSANPFFADGDFEGGILAMLSAIEVSLDVGVEPDDNGTDAGSGGPASDPVELVEIGDNDSGYTVVVALGIAGSVIGGIVLVGARNARNTARRRRRGDRVDGLLARLDVSGHELPQLGEFALPAPQSTNAVQVGVALSVLQAISDDVRTDASALEALWSEGLLVVVDTTALASATEVPLELSTSGEANVLEESVQAAARAALDIELSAPELFTVAVNDLERLVSALRPHRVASARRRTGEQIVAATGDTGLGSAIITDRGARFLRAGPAMDPDQGLAATVVMMDSNYSRAEAKTERLAAVYAKLPSSSVRPAVAAALADVHDDPEVAVGQYEAVRTELTRLGNRLENDGLSIEAIAALLLMNNSDGRIAEFVGAYTTNRELGFPADEAVEHALAGLTKRKQIELIRDRSEDLGIPVSITAALIRRRDDGIAIFEEVLAELPIEVELANRRTIAAILAISLEPAQAARRWTDARRMLADLGLEGSYADIAAAYGASDPRGPREFALSYAATRQALANSSIDDADRFAPELAHQGTREQTDTWTGRPLDSALGTFDPFTMLYYRWIITGGTTGSRGWEPIYNDASWSGDTDSWFGGFGGGRGFGGGSSSGGSWGGSSWSSGGGGFSSGGGFSGGGSFGGGGGSSGGGW